MQNESTDNLSSLPTTTHSLDQLEQLVQSSQFDSALALSLRLQLEPSYTSYLAQRVYLSLSSDRPPSLDDLERLFPLIVDDEWLATAACHVLRSPSTAVLEGTTATTPSQAVALYALEKGLEASDVFAFLHPELGELIEEDDRAGLNELVHKDAAVRKGCWVRKVLLGMGDRKKTWEAIWGDGGIEPRKEDEAEEDGDESVDPEQLQQEVDVEDGWGDMDIPEPHSIIIKDAKEKSQARKHPSATLSSAPSLPQFLSQPLLDSALALAASSQLEPLKLVVSHHSDELWPHRFTIIDAIPEWQDPAQYAELLPSLGRDDLELKWLGKPWRQEKDWVDNVALDVDDDETELSKGEKELLSAERLSNYYTKRIERVASLGLVSTALSLVQHCATLNVSRLEELGEELSLLSRLVYDRPSPDPIASTSKALLVDAADIEELTLAHWRSLEPAQIIQAYLSTSTPSTIAASIRRLVLPYLSVLEARLERAGTPDTTLSSRLLNDYLLGLAASTPSRLDLLAAVFDASKPTLAHGTRLIKSDENLARLALACIYGSRDSSPDALVLMGKIFECLPAFDSTPTSDASSSATTTSTLFSIVSTHTTSRSLFASLEPFTAARLSTSLDALDLHLSEAEIFSRYSCPVHLAWFLTSHSDLKAQRAWATRLARTASTGGGGKIGDEGEFESEDEWVALMEDMVALTQGAEDGALRKAFGLMDTEEVLRIFFGGLIAAGRISLAKSLLQPSSRSAPLEPKAIEELVIAASREFYDNAPSGNLNKGEMKMAFDCLSAAPQTPEIRKERDFIEATSRLCSFKIHSHPGIPVAPIEIRLSKDRLEFVGRLLAANEDAYRHPDVILELVDKLGYRGDRLAAVRTLAMIADSSLQAGDFERTVEVCDKMVHQVEEIRRATSSSDQVEEEEKKKSLGDEAAEVVWKECFQLGKHELFDDLERRLVALGQALLLCPGDKIVNLLPVWTDLEQRVAHRPALERRGQSTRLGVALSSVNAKETFSRAAAFFSGGGGAPSSHPTPAGVPQEKNADRRSSIYGLDQVAPPSPSSSSIARVPIPSSPRAHPTPQQQQQRERSSGHREGGFRAGITGIAAAGVGWLIGADEERERHLQHQEQWK